MNYVHVAEGIILTDVEVTSLTIIGAQLSNGVGVGGTDWSSAPLVRRI